MTRFSCYMNQVRAKYVPEKANEAANADGEPGKSKDGEVKGVSENQCFRPIPNFMSQKKRVVFGCLAKPWKALFLISCRKTGGNRQFSFP